MKRILFLFLALSLSFSTLAFAHGGRTDEYGGHHDYNNVSGLGDYHYHHGYEAHLHPNGVCPYEAEAAPAEPAEPIVTDTEPIVTDTEPIVTDTETDEIEEKFNSLLEEDPAAEEPAEEYHTESNDLYEPVFLLCSIVGGVVAFYFLFLR